MDLHFPIPPLLRPYVVCRYVSTCLESVSTRQRQLVRFLCFATLCLVPVADTIGQQSTAGLAVSPVPPAEEPSWQSRGSAARRNSASDLLNAAKVADRDIDNRDLVPRPSQERIAIDLGTRQREREAMHRRLREQLQRLEDRWKQLAATATQQTQQDPAPPVQPPVPTVPSDAAPVTDPASLPTTEPSGDEDAGSTQAPVSTPPAVAATDSVFADGVSADAIVDGPVDRIGLADSLYALDELSLALEMYGKVDLKNVSASERYWVSFQRACCLRKLNRVPEAQEFYRRLAGQQNAGWLAKMSRWWLDQIDARVELETQIQEYDKLLAALKESSIDSTK